MTDQLERIRSDFMGRLDAMERDVSATLQAHRDELRAIRAELSRVQADVVSQLERNARSADAARDVFRKFEDIGEPRRSMRVGPPSIVVRRHRANGGGA